MSMSHQMPCVSPEKCGKTTMLHLVAVPSVGQLLPKKREQMENMGSMPKTNEHRAEKACEKMCGTTAKNG